MAFAEFIKNRERESVPTFANINLLGHCNANCYFCLGKDIAPLISGRRDLEMYFEQWPNWAAFMRSLQESQIRKVYVTGQNTDALLYRYLAELVGYLQTRGFEVGLRTNGRLALSQITTINSCLAETGYSINSLSSDTNRKIMGWMFVPEWNAILSATERPRVSMVIGRHNCHELIDVVRLVKRHPHVLHFQARRISTDTRQPELVDDAWAYDMLERVVAGRYEQVGSFHGAPIYSIEGVNVTFWRTVTTSINSINYFTDGTLSDEYFVVEGYLNHRETGESAAE